MSVISRDRTNSRKLYCVVLLLFLIDLLCENYVVSLFDSLNYAPKLAWLFLLMPVQIILAPVQASASDHFTRKKTIYVALASNFLCILTGLVFL